MGSDSPNPTGLKAFTLLLALLCGVNGLWANAESLYQTSPKLSHRSRTVAPLVSPLLPVKKSDHPTQALPKPTEQAVQKPEASPLIPVSYQASPAKASFETAPAPTKPATQKPAKPSRPKRIKSSHPAPNQPVQSADNPVKPALTPVASTLKAPQKAKTQPAPKPPKDPKASTKAHSKPKGHPVVIAPEPLLPTPQATTPPVSPVGQKSAVARSKPANNHQSSMHPVAYHPEPPGKTADSNIKSMEHHPQSTQAHPRHLHAQKNSEWEPGFYPVGYHPYVPPAMTLKAREHQTALTHYHRAGFYGQTSQMDLAIREYQEAIRQNPMLADAYVGLSSAYLFKNNWEDAILQANKALTMKAGFVEPGNITQARYNLSTAYCAADDFGKAKRFYKQVKAANHPRTDALWRYIQTNCKP